MPPFLHFLDHLTYLPFLRPATALTIGLQLVFGCGHRRLDGLNLRPRPNLQGYTKRELADGLQNARLAVFASFDAVLVVVVELKSCCSLCNFFLLPRLVRVFTNGLVLGYGLGCLK